MSILDVAPRQICSSQISEGEIGTFQIRAEEIGVLQSCCGEIDPTQWDLNSTAPCEPTERLVDIDPF